MSVDVVNDPDTQIVLGAGKNYRRIGQRHGLS
jgi:hypothetical protein